MSGETRPQVMIVRLGSFLTVSRDGREPLDPDEHEIVTGFMQYVRKFRLNGRQAWQSGEYQPMRFEPQKLYTFDRRRGRLECPAGYLDRIASEYARAGYRVLYVDKTRWRDDRLAADWDALASAELRPNQRRMLEVADRRIRERRGGQFSAVCGAGKSYWVRYFCELYPEARVVVTSPAVDTVDGMMRHLQRRFTYRVGQFGDGKKARPDTHRIIVTTADSMHHVPDGWADLAIVDEAHEYATDERMLQVLRYGQSAVVLGLSASLQGRGDGTDAHMEPMFGPVVYELGWAAAIRMGVVVPIEVRMHAYSCDENPVAGVKEDYARKRWGYWRNDARNAKIAEVARSLPADEQTLIIASTAEHALRLKALLPDFEVAYALEDEERLEKLSRQRDLHDVECKPMTRDERKRLREGFEAGTIRKVIATYVWKRGVSFERLQHLIRADGGRSDILSEQIPGRVSRTHADSGKTHGVVHDFVDNFDQGFLAASRHRVNNYRSKTWEVIYPGKRPRQGRLPLEGAGTASPT